VNPANQVTTARAAGALGCAAIVVLDLAGRLGEGSWWLAVVAGPTLLLDLLDGHVARRTRSVTELGTRFDMEVDAAMVAILSASAVAACPPALLVGASRYVLALGQWVRPAWRGVVAPRRSRRRVAAAVAVLLWTATLPVLPAAAIWACILVALVLLAWSFGTQVIELERGSAAVAARGNASRSPDLRARRVHASTPAPAAPTAPTRREHLRGAW